MLCKQAQLAAKAVQRSAVPVARPARRSVVRVAAQVRRLLRGEKQKLPPPPPLPPSLLSQSPPGPSRAPLTPASAGFGPCNQRIGAIAARISRGRGIATWGRDTNGEMIKRGRERSTPRPLGDVEGARTLDTAPARALALGPT